MGRALQLKKEGIHIVLVTRYEDYSLVDSYRINKQCPDGVESAEALFKAAAKDTAGICYEYAGKSVQQVGKNQGLFAGVVEKSGPGNAVVIEFEKVAMPVDRYRGVVKGYKVYKYVPAPDRELTIPLVRAVVVKQIK
jgi:hypothetical protein